MSDEDEFSLEDSMRESYREITEDTEEDVVDEPEERQDRERDEKGRFVAKAHGDAGVVDDADETADEEEADSVGEGPDDDIQGIVVDEDQQITPVEEEEPSDPSIANAPPTLTAEAKSKWAELPAWAKREFHKREADSVKGFENIKAELSEAAEYGQRIQALVDPYLPMIQSEGGNAESAVQEMLNTAYILRTGTPRYKAQAALQLAQQYGFINDMVAILSGNVQNSNHAPPQDPRVDELLRRQEELEQSKEQEALDSGVRQVEEFASATDENGQLLHPYFENVKEDMYAVLQSGRAEDLETAYEAALWMNPETRTLQAREQTSQLEQERHEQAKERAKKARKANKVNIAKRGDHDPSSPEKPTGSIEDTMRETMERLSAG
jgi:hypothetical protein